MNRSNKKTQMQTSPASARRFWLQAAGLAWVAIAYWVAVRIGLLFVVQPEGIASIWPASGLALAILLLNPKREWAKLLAVIFVTNAAGNWSGGNSLWVSLGFALVNLLEALAGAWVLTCFCKSRITFGRTVEISALFGVAILCNGLTALLGAAVPALAFGAPYLHTWQVWWTSDGLGMILVTPLIVTWATSQNFLRPANRLRLVEAGILTVALAAFAWLLFGSFTVAEEPVLRNYMLFPILIWLAFRYSPRGMASALVVLAVIAVGNTLQGTGIFGFEDQTATEHLVSVQMLLIVTSFSGLLLSAVVTERKQSEGAMRESEDKFKYIFDNSSVGKSITLPSGEISVNHAFCEMLGYSAEELAHRTWQEITHPDDLELTQEMINALLSNKKETVRFNKRYLHKNGSVVWTDISTSLRRDKDGKALYFMTTINDITARMQAEEALRASEEKFRLAFSTSPDSIALTRLADGMFISVNKGFEHLTGYIQEEVLGKTSLEINIWKDPEDRRKVVEGLRANGEVQNYAATFLTKKGEIYGLMSAAILQLDGVAHILNITRDITEFKRAEEEIRSLNAELEKRVEARTLELHEIQERLIRQERLAVLGQLAGSVGHELRNPLGVISNAAYYLQLTLPEVGDKTREYLQIIASETRTAEKIIADLLDFSRNITIEREVLEVGGLLKQTLERFPAPTPVSVELDVPGDLPTIQADTRQMVQVLGNLVVNAFQAMPKGGKLTLSGRRRGDMVAITVRDSGTGIAPEDLKKIFEPLFTTKMRGIGLGLAVSRRLAEANGGRIEVESELGQGATFTVFLPVMA